MTRRKKALKKEMNVTPVSSVELCKSLVAMAAFSLHDNPGAQKLVYAAVRQLQLLDAAARKAGILADGEEQPR